MIAYIKMVNPSRGLELKIAFNALAKLTAAIR